MRLTGMAARRNRDALTLCFLTCAALAACGSVSRSTSPLTSQVGGSGPPASAAPWCTPADLTVSTLPISPQTGEHGLVLAFRDHLAPCVVQGRPSIRLLDHNGSTVRLAITTTNTYVKAIPARAVRLTPGRRAYVLVAKYRCDTGDAQIATAAEIRLPQSRWTMTADVGSVDLARCRGPRHRPGQTIAVSPFVTSTRQFEVTRPG
ncbi:MAG: DUF4232 domain-containing protein [Nocardioides sp.]|nr:DUF4232 domain-containing protein [Nocardioides sp.]